jgi:hypothetical protein
MIDNLDQAWILLGLPAIQIAVGLGCLYLSKRDDARAALAPEQDK